MESGEQRPVLELFSFRALRSSGLKFFRTPLQGIVRIVIESEVGAVTFTGLSDMQAFLEDVLSTFERCTLVKPEMAELTVNTDRCGVPR